MKNILALLFVLFTLGINVGMLYFSPVLGVVSNCVTIIIYLLFAVYAFYDVHVQNIFVLCATFCLINLINLSLHFSGIYVNTLIIYILLLFISLLFCLKIFHEKRLFQLKNLKHIYVIFPIGILLGFVLYYFISFSQFLTLEMTHMQAITLLIITTVAEAIFFQALIQNTITEMTDSITAIIFTSILYGIFHFSNNIFYLLIFIILSITYCVLYGIWKNIYIAIGINLVVQITFYLLTSHLLLFALQ